MCQVFCHLISNRSILRVLTTIKFRLFRKTVRLFSLMLVLTSKGVYATTNQHQPCNRPLYRAKLRLKMPFRVVQRSLIWYLRTLCSSKRLKPCTHLRMVLLLCLLLQAQGHFQITIWSWLNTKRHLTKSYKILTRLSKRCSTLPMNTV